MRDDDQSDQRVESAADKAVDQPSDDAASDAADRSGSPHPSLTDELATLIDDGRTYAEAEIAFQKTRASLAGRKIGAATGFVVLALLIVHLILVALVIGLLIALTPPFGIWGAIALVVGGLMLLLATTLWLVKANASGISALFKDEGS